MSAVGIVLSSLLSLVPWLLIGGVIYAVVVARRRGAGEEDSFYGLAIAQLSPAWKNCRAQQSAAGCQRVSRRDERTSREGTGAAAR